MREEMLKFLKYMENCLAPEYLDQLNDFDDEGWYGTDRGVANDNIFPFLEWCKRKFEKKNEIC